jgi:hypothetical protein
MSWFVYRVKGLAQVVVERPASTITLAVSTVHDFMARSIAHA